MKKPLLFFSIVLLFINIVATEYYPGRLIVAFNSSGIRSNLGEIEIAYENGIVQTQFDWFNALSTEYEINYMRKVFNPKNKEWNLDGIYLSNVFYLRLQDHSRRDDLRVALESLPEIIYAEPEIIYRSLNTFDTQSSEQQSLTPNDPQLVNQWAMRVIEAEMAWHFETGSPDVVIGIVDSGVKWNHPDLAANIWTNLEAHPGIELNWHTGEIVGGTGNEIVLGWDFVVRDTYYPPWTEESNNPYQSFPGNEHGTHVSGCSAAVGNNGIGVAGPAYTSKVMNTKHTYTYEASRSIIRAYEGVQFLVDNGANIINCSWGGGGDSYTANLVGNYAKNAGVLVLASAGNHNADNEYLNFMPANAQGFYGVIATDSADRKASFSAYGRNMGISSPGVGILSTYYGQQGENSYSNASGTSMASPIAAGVAALILSYYPDLTPDGIIERLELGAEPIDHLNDDRYAGKLGAGRINAFNSLMYDRLPRVDFESYEQIHLTGNDNTLNPGETVTFVVSLKNRESFIDGLPTTARIVTDNPYVTIIKDTVEYGYIPSGEIVTSNDSFIVSFADNTPVETHAIFTLVYHADGGTGVTFDYETSFTISVTRNKDNWPIDTRAGLATSYIVFDFNQDGENNIIYIDTTGSLHVTNTNHESLPNFPVTITGQIIGQLGIIRSGDDFEILVTRRNGLTKVNKYGVLTSSENVDGLVNSTAVSYDINNNGYENIAIGTARGWLYLFNNDLTIHEGYPKSLNSNIFASVIFVDFNKDGKIDILACTTSKHLHIFTADNGEEHAISPIFTNIGPIAGMVAAENNNDVFIYLAGNVVSEDNLTVINKTGNILTTSRTDASITTQPILADLTGSGSLDYISVTSEGTLYVYDSYLRIREGFPVALNFAISHHPILADIDNDGNQEIIIASNNGSLHAINYKGESVEGFPYVFNGMWRSSPFFADIDGNGKINLLLSNLFNLLYIELPINYSESQYPMFAYNRNRNSVYSANFVNEIEPKPTERNQTRLLGNYPNPFNPSTTIAFSIEDIPNRSISAISDPQIQIFNIKGQKIKTFNLTETDIRNGFITWDADDHASGVYLYRLLIDNNSVDVKRALLLK